MRAFLWAQQENGVSNFLEALDSLFQRTQEDFFSDSPLRPIFQYHYESGGKRLRPLIVEAVYEWAHLKGNVLVTRELEDRLRFALAVELIHNATLIHDDLQDGDILRRGRPTVWKTFGVPQAVNAGDAWFFAAMRLIQESKFPNDTKERLTNLLSSCTLAVVDGQSREFSLQEKFRAGEIISVDDYWRMVDGKTSALFSMTIEGGLVLAGMDPLPYRPLVRNFGRLFQLEDDYLDLWGKKGRERAGSDIAEGKISFMVAWTLTEGILPTSDLSELRRILLTPREQTSDQWVNWAIECFERAGAKEKARAVCAEFKDLAALSPGVKELGQQLLDRFWRN
jgi:geranylgeranyl diphosphate synthase, type I